MRGSRSSRQRADSAAQSAARDCQRTRSQLFADSLLHLGARSIQFDSILLDEAG